MTSLSSQLRNLQIPDALSVLNLRDKRASILFDANEAADIDIDTVFSLGKTGLHELQEINDDFAKFEKTLFSDNVKMMERTQEPKEFNQKLNKKIKEFLILLSPYFLIKPAQKTLEWLIRRFRIHVFNVDDLICCVLPFHETNLFARVLSTITLNKQTEKWDWLSQARKSGAPLPKSVLIQHCLSDSSFLTFICQMLPEAIDIKKNTSSESFKTLCSFYTGVLLGVAESSRNLTESRIGIMLPFLYQGLRSEMADYKASSYMVLTQMCGMKILNEQVTSSLVDQICKTLSGETARFGILALECIYRSQKAAKLSSKALKIICSSKEILHLVDELANGHALVSFQPILLTSLCHSSLIYTQSKETISKNEVDYEELAIKFLQDMDLAPNAARYILRNICQQYMKLKEVSTDKDRLLQTGQKFIGIFEKRYPVESDLVLQTFASQCKSEEETDWLQELILVGQNAAKYRVLPGSETSLLLSLNHPNAGRRKLAVNELLRITSSENEEMEDQTFARNSLLQRLDDDDDSVVEEVLKGGKALLQIIGEDAIIESFEKKMKYGKSYDRLSLVRHLLEIFKDFESSDELNTKANNLIFEIIPALLPSKQSIVKQVAVWKLLVDSSFGSSNVFIKALQAVVKNIDLEKFADLPSLDEAIQKVWMEIFETTAALLAANNDEDSLVNASLIFAVSANCDDSFKVFLIGVLYHLLDKLDKDKLLALINKMEHYLRCNVDKAAPLCGKSTVLEIFVKSKDIRECFEKLLHKILLKRPKSRKDDLNLLSGVDLFCILLRKVIQMISVSPPAEQDRIIDVHSFIFELLASASGRTIQKRPFIAVFRFLLQEFLKINFPSSKALLGFLSSTFMTPDALLFLTTDSSECEKIEVYICALHLFKVCLETLRKDIDPFISFECEVLPTLMVLLFHPLKIIREAAMGCIQSFHGNDVVDIDNGLKHLLDCLVDNDTEIVEDRHQICIVLQRLFIPLSNAAKDVKISEPKHLEELRFLTKYLSGFILRSDISLKLGIATITSSVDFQEYLVCLMPVIENLIKDTQIVRLNSLEVKLLGILMKKFNAQNVQIFDKLPNSLITFKSALRIGNISFGSGASIQQECLEQVTTPFYENIAASDTRSKIFSGLLEAAVNSSSSAIIKLIREKLIELPIDPGDIGKKIASLNSEPGVTQAKRAKKTRVAKPPVHQADLELIETPEWSEILLLLEVIQLKENLIFNESLILAIFDLLAFCLEINAANQPSIEYMKQLLLSSLRRSVDEILKSPQRDVIAQEKFSIEKVIECFRSSENPQTHQQALLLLGRAARLFPDLVLHNIMSIFTFMGANVLRQDDSYSFEIIKKTIDAVIPTLMSAGAPEDAGSAKSGPNKDDIVKLVVRVFVDAVPYIPEHRKMLLFQHFASVLGADSYLYIIIAILLEKVLVQMDLGGDNNHNTTDGSLLSQNFPFALMRHFSLHEQAATIANLVEFLAALPDEKQEEVKAKRVTRSIKTKDTNENLVPIFDATKFSTRDIRRYKYRTLDFVSKVLSDKDFGDKASAAGATSMENLYHHLLQEVLEYLCIVGKRAEEGDNPSSVKYWKFQQQKGGEILNKIYKLLTFDVFINVTTQLMQSKNAIIRKKVMELIGEKIKNGKEFSQDEMLKLLVIAKHLIDLVKLDSAEVPTNKHTALQILRPLLGMLANRNASDIADTTYVFVDIFSSSGEHQHISASALLCIGELILALNVHMIQFLPRIMPPMIELLTNESKGKDVVVLNAFLTLHKIICSLSKFMSPYIVSILDILTSTQFDDNAVQSSSINTQIKSKIALLRGEVSQKITPRVLLPALDSCIDKVVNSKHSLLALMEVVKEAIESMSRENIKTNHVKILALFLKAFDIRSFYSGLPEQEVEIAEESIVTAFSGLVMKMSENTFRPMFLKIFTWSTSTEEKSTRLITFYHLCGAIASKLKGLFLLFAGHILKPAAELITKCHVKNDECLQLFGPDHESKTNSLLIFIFDCLQKCFLHDSQGFLTKERFEYLMSPLIDQLDNELGGTSVYNNRVLDHLNPCIAHLATAVNDESCWKTLNYQILLKTRNQVSQVRFAALKLLEEIHKLIGESYLILLPETIPFLAELMEDESFEVEKQCQHVISHMEEILGESLQKYF